MVKFNPSLARYSFSVMACICHTARHSSSHTLKRVYTGDAVVAKLTQRELAEIAGVSASQMSRIESGQRRPRYDEAMRIAQKLSLEPAEVGAQLPPRTTDKRIATASLPLHEGCAVIEYPAVLSPESRAAFKLWLELIAQLATR